MFDSSYGKKTLKSLFYGWGEHFIEYDEYNMFECWFMKLLIHTGQISTFAYIKMYQLHKNVKSDSFFCTCFYIMSHIRKSLAKRNVF